VDKKDFDISIIRPEMRAESFKWRREGLSGEDIKGIKRGLHALHTLETMAINIYKFQISRKSSELNLQLIRAMGNEMTHFQDFQVKLFEYGFKPSKLKFLYWIVGFGIVMQSPGALRYFDYIHEVYHYKHLARLMRTAVEPVFDLHLADVHIIAYIARNYEIFPCLGNS